MKERSLYAAILTRALNDLSVKSEQIEAWEWFNFDNPNTVTFTQCCEVLSIDRDQLLRHANELFWCNYGEDREVA